MSENEEHVKHQLELHKVTTDAKFLAAHAKIDESGRAVAKEIEGISKRLERQETSIKWGVMAVIGFVINSLMKSIGFL